MKNITEKLIQIINDSYMDMKGSCLITRPFISNQQLIGAAKCYTKGVNPDSIVAMIDISLDNNGTEGIVFSTSAIYFSKVEIPTGIVKGAMLRYVDIDYSEVNNCNWGQYSGELKIITKNIPYQFYKINSITINKKAFSKLLFKITELSKDNIEFENDRNASLTNVRDYLNRRDEYMKEFVRRLNGNQSISNVRVDMVDSMGLTPMHYLISYKSCEKAMVIMSKTMDKNAELYLINNPFGVYNYCMNIVMTGKVDPDSGRFGLFYEMFKYTGKLYSLEKSRRKLARIQFGKELLKKTGDILVECSKIAAEEVNKYNEAMENAQVEKLTDNIARQEEKVEKMKIWVRKENKDYQKLIQEMKKLEEMKERASEIQDDVSSYCEEYEEECEEYEEYEEEPIDDNYDEIKNRSLEQKYDDVCDEIEKEINNHLEGCKKALERKWTDYKKGMENVDPRLPIICKLMHDKWEMLGRLNAENKILICFKYKYFFIPSSYINEYPELRKLVCED